MENGISTLIFDLGGVILNLNYQLTIDAFKILGVTDFDARYSQATQSSLFDDFEIGKISEVEFRNGIREFINSDLTDLEIDNAWNAMLIDLPYERIKLLNDLKAKYRILLYSNTNAIHLRKFRELIGEQHGDFRLLESVFDQTYYSHKIGRRKPDPESFQFILDDQDLFANEVAFIDDSLQHVEGAKSIGMVAFHLIEQDVINLCKSQF